MYSDIQGKIQPWHQDKGQNYQQIFKRRLKTIQTSSRAENYKQFNKTEIVIRKNFLSKKNKSDIQNIPQNLSKIINIDFQRGEVNRTNLERSFLAAKRETVTANKRKMMQRLTIDSIKKQILNLRLESVSPTEKHLKSTAKTQSRLLSAKVLSQQKMLPPNPNTESSYSLYVQKASIEQRQPKYSNDFISQIANFCKQKDKIMREKGRKSFNTQHKLQRQLFITHNRKFKHWSQAQNRANTEETTVIRTFNC